ncbi:uncharacterized protein [Triticum aestivum]|uniref:uncharacterized protein isoform X2 n=1 Tax=Triticum aestivum TaxID=4565 RepID=UPI001D00FC0E|nr:uncharacterized protein LOC123100161 isoform X2 [Triticum aestivum]
MKAGGDETEPTSRFEKSNALSVHLDYCSKQLSKFEMEEFDVEEENINMEMECLPEDLTLAMNSVKRSLLESLERADSVVKKKLNIKNSPTWGPVLAGKPMTRKHGDVKIMDKAAAYMMKKNLEMPATFKGAQVEECEMHSCKTKLLFTPMESSLRRWASKSSATMHPPAGQTTWGTPLDCLEVRLEGTN